MRWSRCAATGAAPAFSFREPVRRAVNWSCAPVRHRRPCRSSPPAAAPPTSRPRSQPLTPSWTQWRSAAGGSRWRSMARKASPSPSGRKSAVWPRIAGPDCRHKKAPEPGAVARGEIFATKKIKNKTCFAESHDSNLSPRRANTCVTQFCFNNRKEVIRCLMVQLRGRAFPFGGSAAGNSLTTTPGSGCLGC